MTADASKTTPHATGTAGDEPPQDDSKEPEGNAKPGPKPKRLRLDVEDWREAVRKVLRDADERGGPGGEHE